MWSSIIVVLGTYLDHSKIVKEINVLSCFSKTNENKDVAESQYMV